MKRLITRFSRMSRSEFISLSAILISVNLNWVFIMVFKGIFADFGVIKLTPFRANESLWIFLFLNIIASISSFFIPKKIRNIGSAIIISSIPSGIILFPIAIKTNILLIYAEIFLSILVAIGCFIYELKKARANKKNNTNRQVTS